MTMIRRWITSAFQRSSGTAPSDTAGQATVEQHDGMGATLDDAVRWAALDMDPSLSPTVGYRHATPTADEFYALLGAIECEIDAVDGSGANAFAAREALRREAWDASVSLFETEPTDPEMVAVAAQKLIPLRQFGEQRPGPTERSRALAAMNDVLDTHVSTPQTASALLAAARNTVLVPAYFVEEATMRRAVAVATRIAEAHPNDGGLLRDVYDMLAECLTRSPSEDVCASIAEVVSQPLSEAALAGPDDHTVLIARHRVVHDLSRRHAARFEAATATPRLLDEMERINGRAWRRGAVDVMTSAWAINRLVASEAHRAHFLAAAGVERIADLRTRVRSLGVTGVSVLLGLGWTPHMAPTSAHLAVMRADASLESLRVLTETRPDSLTVGRDANGRTAVEAAIASGAGRAIRYMAAAGIAIPDVDARPDVRAWIAEGVAARKAAIADVADAAELDMDTASVVVAHAGLIDGLMGPHI